MEERRISDVPAGDTSRILAILYTLGYFAIVGVLLLRGIPAGNEDTLNMLMGILSLIQAGIIKFYFDGTKAGEVQQIQVAASKERSDAAMIDIAKAAPAPNGDKPKETP